jgi:arsenical pump membrane protein
VSTAAAEALSVLALLAVLAFAVAVPRGLPEATLAVPLAVLVVSVGALPRSAAQHELRALLPTVVFLAAVLVLGHLCEVAGVFRYAGAAMGTLSRGSPARLLGWVFTAAAVATAVLSLDATVVLLTPVVFATATSLNMRPKPHVYACTHLANSASLLLPVSNLTNLLAFSASGLTFLHFGALMALPWLTVLGVEWVAFRLFFAADLASSGARRRGERAALPAFALTVVALTMVGFGVSSLVHIQPLWPAAAGAGVLLARELAASPRGAHVRVLRAALSAASPLFAVFVLALGVVVAAAARNGIGTLVRDILPGSPTLLSLLAVAAVAAALSNLVNNLPAVLLLVPTLASNGAALVLAALLGVNIGPNLSYVGSLATLLWRRLLRHRQLEPALGEYVRLGVITVAPALLAGVLALWAGLRTIGAG